MVLGYNLGKRPPFGEPDQFWKGLDFNPIAYKVNIEIERSCRRGHIPLLVSEFPQKAELGKKEKIFLSMPIFFLCTPLKFR